MKGKNITRKKHLPVHHGLSGMLCLIAVLAMSLTSVLPEAMIPASAEETPALYCGLEEHEHTDDCWKTRLICTLEETDGHTHSEECYERQKVLICTDESEDHTHDDSCYEIEQVLICGQEEVESHTHTDDCYETYADCGEVEHTHSLQCQSNPEADTETASDWTTLFAGMTFGSEYTENLIMVAESQLEYKESEKNFQVQEDGETKNGYTRYGAWAGFPYEDWNCFFVRFCLNYAKIPTSAFPQADTAEKWIQALQSKNGYDLYETAEWTPVPGDLVFLDRDKDGKAETVGIISSMGYDGKTADEEPFDSIYVILGDSNDAVEEISIDLNGSSIIGYGLVSQANPDDHPGLNGYTGLRRVTLHCYTASWDNPTGSVKNYTYNPVNEYKNDSRYQCYTKNKSYLIPVAYLEEAYADAGYVFDPNDTAYCPFIACRSSGSSYNNMRTASYWQDPATGDWYVMAESDSYSELWFYYILTRINTQAVQTSSTVINMFDYWCYPSDADRFKDDNHPSNSNELKQGINRYSGFKFGKGMSSTDYGEWNYSGGSVNPPRTGIVARTLGTDGYPYLNGANTEGRANGMKDSDTQSLAYLFDPNMQCDGKASFSNCTGLLQVDSNGYFYYDSAQNYAYLDEETKAFTLYDQPAGYNTSFTPAKNYGQFYPFNPIQEVGLLQCEKSPINHYFGLSMTTRFVQANHGHTTEAENVKTTFDFSGDNDVWIYVDDVLIADSGGLGSARSLTIDFATGAVTVNYNNNGSYTTTIYEQFVAAGKEDTVTWTESRYDSIQKIFANETTHTLKFYYLERGNYDSNLRLKFNLKEIPPTSILKLDQYGMSVPGASFGLYATKTQEVEGAESINGLDSRIYSYRTTTGEYITLDPASISVSEEDGTITDQVTGKTIKPVLSGTTDSTGMLTFRNSDGVPYSLDELKALLGGSSFIIREYKVPDGYREVASQGEIKMEIRNGRIICTNSFESGSWSSATAMITAPNTLFYTDVTTSETDASEKPIYDSVPDWYDPVTGTSQGILFGVILKRNGEKLNEVADVGLWHPVSGNDLAGYTIWNLDTLQASGSGYTSWTREAVVAAAIAACSSYADENGNNAHIFSPSASGMQIVYEEMPGNPEEYWTYLYAHLADNAPPEDVIKLNPEYYMAYFYSTADTWKDVSVTNTNRVWSRKNVLSQEGYQPFSVDWGGVIEVPNVENKLFFQKVAQEESRDYIPNTIFAMYRAGEFTVSDEGTETLLTYYEATDSNGNSVRAVLEADAANPNMGSARIYSTTGTYIGSGSYVIYSAADPADYDYTQELGYITSEQEGVITIQMNGGGTCTIRPAVNAEGRHLVGFTHDACVYVSRDGTGHFGLLLSGTYILREIQSAQGYTINGAETKVVVDSTGVYANAGTADNHVDVAKGAGYLVSTMDMFASSDSIDETLRWIYGILATNQPDSFSVFLEVNTGTADSSWYYAARNNSETTVGYRDEDISWENGSDAAREAAMRIYLEYDKADTIPNAGKIFSYELNSGRTGGQDSYVLLTKEGWSDLIIFQDYEYGSTHHDEATTTYSDLRTAGRSVRGNILYLFSGSTFVIYTDEIGVDLTILKTDEAGTPLAGAGFTLSYVDETGQTLYYNPADSGYVTLSETLKLSDVTLTSGKDGIVRFLQIPVNEIGYTLREVQVPSGQNITYEPMADLTVTVGQQVITGEEEEGIHASSAALNYYAYLQVAGKNTTLLKYGDPYYNTDSTNSQYLLSVKNTAYPNLTLLKVDAASRQAQEDGTLSYATGLEGALFLLKQVKDENGKSTELYYVQTADGYAFRAAKEGETEEDLSLSTDTLGRISYASLKDGKYELREVRAPSGYSLLPESSRTISLQVQPDENGRHVISLLSPENPSGITLDGDGTHLYVENSLKSMNTTLPDTGGWGWLLFILLAASLIIGGGTWIKKKKLDQTSVKHL